MALPGGGRTCKNWGLMEGGKISKMHLWRHCWEPSPSCHFVLLPECQKVDSFLPMYSQHALLRCYRSICYELMNHELKYQKWKPNQSFPLSRGSQVVLLQHQKADCYNPFPKIIFVLCFTFKVAFTLPVLSVSLIVYTKEFSPELDRAEDWETISFLAVVRHRWQQSGRSNFRQYTVWRPTQSSDGWRSWLVLQRELEYFLSITFMHPATSNEGALVQSPREWQGAKEKRTISAKTGHKKAPCLSPSFHGAFWVRVCGLNLSPNHLLIVRVLG